MRAHQLMTRQVITIDSYASIIDAANTMLKNHISGLPVVDTANKLVGIVSQGDFIRRAEIGTQHKPSRWLRFLIGTGKSASEFIHEHGRKVSEIMTPAPYTVIESTPIEDIVHLMETKSVKRLPVLRGDQIVGIVTRSNLLQAVATLAREVPDPTADDDHIRSRIVASIEKNDWRPLGLGVTVREGIVHLHGVITDDRSRQASIVAAENVSGVKKIYDHLCWVDPMSGMYLNSPEDEKLAQAS